MAKQTYDPASIEPRWQRHWEHHQTFRTPNPGDADFDATKPKFYVLDMFPYPSGAGLHVGHPEGYTATDITARYHRMRGRNVLHPMGWDAFGLPAEQYAIQKGRHPAETTRENCDNFRRQLKALGFSYDWDREISTADPAFYRWTQWIFARLHERGLAFMSEAPVWWCEALGTVLANDEVVDGRSERGDHPCTRVPLRQWMLRITDYAERLLNDLDELDWSESLKTMQREWIGRSEGAEVDFAVDTAPQTKIRVFTTRPDTLFGASFLVLAPEHPLVDQLVTTTQRAAVDAYRTKAAAKSELDRTDLAKEMTGVFTGAYGRNPLFEANDPRSRLPIWIADYVIVTYGTGAIMAVPAGDERDFRFATAHGLPVPPIFAPSTDDPAHDAAVRAGTACFTGHAPYANSTTEGLDLTPLSQTDAKRAVIAFLEARSAGTAKVTYRLRDWLFSRQRYWGEPFPLVHRQDGTVELLPDDALPLQLPVLEDFRPSGRPEPTLEKAADWVRTTDRAGAPALRETNTMPGSAGSSWYFLRFCDPRNDAAPFSFEAQRYWMPVDLYVGGTEHAIGHLLYARFWHKVLFDLGLVSTKEPFGRLYNQGMILSYAFEDARGGIVPVTEAEEDGAGGHRHTPTGAPLKRIVTKMSKRYHNVVNPDDVVAQYGADTLRLYEMFMGPLADAKPWNPDDVPGVHRFLGRVWRLVVPEDDSAGSVHAHFADSGATADMALERTLHRTIAKVGADVERLAFNTAIAAMMTFVNDATKAGGRLLLSQARRFVLILAPFAPHIAEELWRRLGGNASLAYEPWPSHDPAMLKDDEVELAVQVTGKIRGRITVAADADEATVLQAARAAVAEHLTGKTIVKEIVVRGRLVNFVAK
jgi:leucyl-tRNA synthetase